MKQCTVSGCREEPGLPLQELNDLKALMFSLLPQYWTGPTQQNLKAYGLNALYQLDNCAKKFVGRSNKTFIISCIIAVLLLTS